MEIRYLFHSPDRKNKEICESLCTLLSQACIQPYFRKLNLRYEAYFMFEAIGPRKIGILGIFGRYPLKSIFILSGPCFFCFV
jgi:hypothetical protein